MLFHFATCMAAIQKAMALFLKLADGCWSRVLCIQNRHAAMYDKQSMLSLGHDLIRLAPAIPYVVDGRLQSSTRLVYYNASRSSTSSGSFGSSPASSGSPLTV